MGGTGGKDTGQGRGHAIAAADVEISAGESVKQRCVDSITAQVRKALSCPRSLQHAPSATPSAPTNLAGWKWKWRVKATKALGSLVL